MENYETNDSYGMDDNEYLLYLADYAAEVNQAQIERVEEPFKELDWESLNQDVAAHGVAWVGRQAEVLGWATGCREDEQGEAAAFWIGVGHSYAETEYRLELYTEPDAETGEMCFWLRPLPTISAGE